MCVCVGGGGREDLLTCVLTENVLLDSSERCEEARPVSILGKNILGRGKTDSEALRWEWVWYPKKGQGADTRRGDDPDRW